MIDDSEVILHGKHRGLVWIDVSEVGHDPMRGQPVKLKADEIVI